MKNPPQTRRQFFSTTTAVAAASAVLPARPVNAVQGGSHSKTIKTDVLVCGGGCAGTAAALAAARRGAKVLLVEKAPFAGGIITSVGLPYFDGIAHITTRRVVVRGIALELLSKSGVCAPDAQTVAKHNPTIPNTFEFKLLLDRLFQEHSQNLSVLFNSFVCGVQTQGDRITSVTVANKDGMVSIQPKVVIDCTGDGDVADSGNIGHLRSSFSLCRRRSAMSANLSTIRSYARSAVRSYASSQEAFGCRSRYSSMSSS